MEEGTAGVVGLATAGGVFRGPLWMNRICVATRGDTCLSAVGTANGRRSMNAMVTLDDRMR